MTANEEGIECVEANGLLASSHSPHGLLTQWSGIQVDTQRIKPPSLKGRGSFVQPLIEADAH